MRKIIYIALIGFLFATGFMNLEGNNWQPVELPSFITGDTEEKILSFQEWKNIMIGTWDFTTNMNSELFTGTVTYNPDGNFVRKISYFFEG